MKIITYLRHDKGLPYASISNDTLFLPKGRGKTITVQYATGKKVKYEMMIQVGRTRSQTFCTHDYDTLANVHKENVTGYEFLFVFKECYRIDGKIFPAVVARFMSFKEWCDFHEDTGL